MTNETPFKVGAEVLDVRYHNGRVSCTGKATVAKVYKNGNVRLQFANGYTPTGQYKPHVYAGMEGGEANLNNWSLRECANPYGRSTFKLKTEELVARLNDGAVDRRKNEVENYISSVLGQRETGLSLEQVARIVAIMNEGN